MGLRGPLPGDDPLPEPRTTGQMLENVFTAFGPKRCVGWRAGAHFNDGFEWWTYTQVLSHAQALRDRLQRLLGGARADACTVGICGANSAEWYVADFACLLSTAGSARARPRLVSVPLHYMLRPGTLLKIIALAQVRCCVCF